MDGAGRRPDCVLLVGLDPTLAERFLACVSHGFEVRTCDARSSLPVCLATTTRKPGIVVIDDALLRQLGLGLLADLRQIAGDVPVLLVAENPRCPMMAGAIALGLRGVIAPGATDEDLVAAVLGIYRGELWLSREMLGEILGFYTGAQVEADPELWDRLDLLTCRENEVLAGVMDGLGNQEIADLMGISRETVKVHLKHIFAKLGVRNRLALMAHRPVPGVTRPGVA